MRGIMIKLLKFWIMRTKLFDVLNQIQTLKSLFQQVYENISEHYEVLACEQLIFPFYIVFTTTVSFWIFRCKQT